MELDLRVHGLGVDIAFLAGMIVDPFLHPRVAEIFGEHPAIGRIFGQDRGSAHTDFFEPVGDVEKRPGILVRRGCMHQHRGLPGHPQPEVTAEAGIADKWCDFSPFPLCVAKELVDAVG